MHGQNHIKFLSNMLLYVTALIVSFQSA